MSHDHDHAAAEVFANPEPRELTDAELEAVTTGKALNAVGKRFEGSNGWYVPLPSKLRGRG